VKKPTSSIFYTLSQLTQCNRNHRLNGSSSPVITATPHSYVKGQNSTPYKIKTPERILTKFGTVDYVPDICPKKQIWWRWDQRGLLGKYVNYTMFVNLFTFSPTDLEVTPQPIFTQNGSNDVHSRIDVPFAVKIKTFSNSWPPGP